MARLRVVRRPESGIPEVDGTAALKTNGVALKRIRGERGVIAQDVTPEGAHRQIVAAAAVLAGGKNPNRKLRVGSLPWQTEVWELRRQTGELRFSGDRVARALSRAKLYVAEITPDSDEPKPTENEDLDALAQELFAQAGPQLLRAGQHITFAGETIIHVEQDPDTGAMTWSARSTREVSGQGKTWKINDGSQVTRDVGPDELLLRCWTPDPEFGYWAESPVQAVLPPARTLRGLNQRTDAEINSRMAGNGLLLVPEDIEVLASAPGAKKAEFLDSLIEMMTTPIKDPNSVAAVVPLVAKVRADIVDKIKLVRFDSALDPRMPEMQDRQIRRIALGMDSDPAVLLGQGTTNHWSGWLIDENESKYVIGPLAATICHAFTIGLLRPLAQQLGLDPSKFLVWYDLSGLEIRPDRTADSRELRKMKVLSTEATLREHGFGPEDAYDPAKEEIPEPDHGPPDGTPPALGEKDQEAGPANPIPNAGKPPK
jgi:hypothetical protein